MPEPPDTRPSLLVRLRDPQDADAWTRFVDLYGPVVYHFARRRGLQDADAADITQETLRAVSAAVGRLEYDPRRGLFRSWLFTLTRRRLADFFEKRERAGWLSSEFTLEGQVDPREPADEREWNREYERRLLEWAMQQVRPTVAETTWAGFYRTAVDGAKAPDVAAELGLTVPAVYIAKSRVQKRLRELIQDAESAAG